MNIFSFFCFFVYQKYKSNPAAQKKSKIILLNQLEQSNNPDSTISFNYIDIKNEIIGDYFFCYQGLRTGDLVRFVMYFWENNFFNKKNSNKIAFQSFKYENNQYLRVCSFYSCYIKL